MVIILRFFISGSIVLSNNPLAQHKKLFLVSLYLASKSKSQFSTLPPASTLKYPVSNLSVDVSRLYTIDPNGDNKPSSSNLNNSVLGFGIFLVSE